jgi:hypothetical protein
MAITPGPITVALYARINDGDPIDFGSVTVPVEIDVHGDAVSGLQATLKMDTASLRPDLARLLREAADEIEREDDTALADVRRRLDHDQA